MKKTYLFDFDGTLVDSMPAFSSVMLKILNDNKIEYDENILKITTPLGYRATSEYYISLGVPSTPEKLMAQMLDMLKAEYETSIPLKEGVKRTLLALKSEGCSLNVLTASPHSVLDACLKRLGIYELFDNVWSCDDFSTTKSNPEIYLRSAKKLGVTPNELIFVDDNISAVKTAKSAGLISYGIYDPSSADYEEEMRAVSDRYIKNFSELAPQTTLYQLTETSEFMMGFVIITKQNNAIVIDGGRAEDMPLLKKHVGGRRIKAWILTHAHHDHIGGFVTELEKNGLKDFDIEKVYYNFPDYYALKDKTEVPALNYFRSELNQLYRFTKNEDAILPLRQIVKQGETLVIDECEIEFLFTYHDGLYSNLLNDSSLVFKVTTPNKSVLFLGDLGPEGGDVLYEESRHKLKADIVQMAHHGHMCVGMEVYASIMPSACMWCCADWLYNEPEIPHYLTDRENLRKMQRERMYGTTVTRKWMDILGVKTHFVTKDGTNEIQL